MVFVWKIERQRKCVASRLANETGFKARYHALRADDQICALRFAALKFFAVELAVIVDIYPICICCSTLNGFPCLALLAQCFDHLFDIGIADIRA